MHMLPLIYIECSLQISLLMLYFLSNKYRDIRFSLCVFWISTPWYSCVYFMLNLASTGQYRLSNQLIACKWRSEARVHLPHIPTRKNMLIVLGTLQLLSLMRYKVANLCDPLIDLLFDGLLNAVKSFSNLVKSLTICLPYLSLTGHHE